MAMFGLDIEQVRQLANTMQQDADVINDLAAKLSGQLQGVQWMGPDAEKFRSDWEGQMQPALRQVSAALVENAQRANQNAAQQEAASA